MFPIDSVMREGMRLAFDQEHEALLSTLMLVSLIVELVDVGGIAC